ncbi:hypothetical protein RND81_01G214700 [Saponaria officinalis]|uniref:Uncharacterized protein n=1 Tax=Saponaria officinalis TaxID=3572 RepID=A0AAW1N905_SAPOF
MNKNMYFVLFTLALILALVRPCCSCCSTASPRSSSTKLTGIFVFGDSTVDNGNNNFIKSEFKSDYLPYGVDFPLGPFSTKRFTNGENPADRIGGLLGLPVIPTFTDPQTKGSRVLRGVNYASAGSGILDVTGSNKGVISLNQQITNFVEVTIPMLKAQQKCEGNTNLVEQYLFLISTGSNDFLDTFFNGGSNIGLLQYFSNNLTSSLATQLNRLYNAGARKFAFINIGPLGCAPMTRASMPKRKCNETLSYAAYYFNTQLLVMLNSIQPRLSGFRYMVVNFFQIGLEFIQIPSSGGFNDVSNSCCEVSLESNGALCKQGGNLCKNRRTTLFFDGLHPNEALYSILATRAYNSTDPTEVSPFNLHRLSTI